MITIKDYAKEKNISYEAVRKQLKRYADDLQDHITIDNRVQYLDDYAVEFLNDKRNKSPIIIQEQSKDEELQQLRDENKNLLIKLAESNEQLAKTRELLLQAKDKEIELLESKQEPTELTNIKSELEDLKEIITKKPEESEKKSLFRRLFNMD